MKFPTVLSFVIIAFGVNALATPMEKRGVPVNLVPQFGVRPGTNPTGTGDCDGIRGPNGAPIKIPCSCPPARGAFINSLNANVNAGHAVNNPSAPVSFPTGPSSGDQVVRMQASIITLQNLNGPGKGCPAASTTFSAQLAAAIKAQQQGH